MRMAAAEDEALKVVLLAAAGDLPDATPYSAVVRSLVDPMDALSGNPKAIDKDVAKR